MNHYEVGGKPANAKKSSVHSIPTAQEVLEWVRSKEGVVMPEWVRSPAQCKLARVVFAGVKGSRKMPGSSPVVKDVINRFYPHVGLSQVCKHSCRVTVSNGDSLMSVWMMESNLPARSQEEVIPASEKKLEYFPYGSCFKQSQPTIFLGVEGIRIFQRA